MRRFKDYARVAPQIPGWFHLEFLPFLVAIDEFHNCEKTSGDIAEIGLHHGKSFIPLTLLAKHGELAVGIDINKESVEITEKNCTAYGRPSGLVFYVGDSFKITEAPASIGSRHYRLVSIDGGHNYATTISDLYTAAGMLTDAGVILIDDVFNADWPEVTHALLDFTTEDEMFYIVVLAWNKAILCRPTYYTSLRNHIGDLVKQRPIRESVLGGASVLSY